MKKKSDFEQFVELFPEIELPVTLGEETHLVFSKKNKPLHPLVIQEFIQPLEEKAIGEMTEIIVGFRLPKTKHFHALVYWRADLMSYQYIIATLNVFGELIDKRTIAGTYSDGFQLTQSAATISDKYIIYVASGQSEVDLAEYEAASTAVQRIKINGDGSLTDLDE